MILSTGQLYVVGFFLPIVVFITVVYGIKVLWRRWKRWKAWHEVDRFARQLRRERLRTDTTPPTDRWRSSHPYLNR